MGLTIHYGLTPPTGSVKVERKRIEALRQACLDLPFEKVFPLQEFKGKDACDYSKLTPNSDNRWILIMASHNDKIPTHVIGFTAYVGAGCESLTLAFTKQGKVWKASGFCKTQYASNPACGGVANFLKCHLLVIKVMDTAKELGFKIDVYDEGNYWEKCDPKALAKEVGEWDINLASFAGALTDAFSKKGDKVKSEIAKYPNFEQLEHQGSLTPSPVVQELQKIG